LADILGIIGIPKASSEWMYTCVMIAKRIILRHWKNRKDLSVVRIFGRPCKNGLV